MKGQQPLYQQFFAEYAKLLRMRLYHYHRNNGGRVSFLNDLIITPAFDESCHDELMHAEKQVARLNEWLADNALYGAALCNVFLDNELNICYQFIVFTEPEITKLEKVEFIKFIVSPEMHEVGWNDDDRIKLTEISDQVWGDMLQDVKEAMSFGTLCLTEAD